jgi:NHLM bacteriocin system ABC transporter ATP-binding protein
MRRHVMRILPGEAFFGLDASNYGALSILACPRQGTTIQCISLDRLRHAVWQEASGAQLLESWVDRLSRVVSNAIIPKVFSALESGEIRVGDEPRVILPLEGVLWAQQLEGSSQFLGNASFRPVNGAAAKLFPITRHGWLEAAAHSRIRLVGTKQVSDLDPRWEGLRQFHETAVACLVSQREVSLAKERARLKVQAEADASRVEAGLRRLTTPLAGEDPLLVAPEQSAPDPLFLAAHAAGQASGIRIKAPPDMLLGIKIKSPITAMARASHVRVRQVLLKDTWWTQDSGPLLAFRDADKSPVALLPKSSSRYLLYDPVTRAKSVVTSQDAAILSGLAYMFYRPFPPVKLSAIGLLAFGAKQAGREVWTIILMGVLSGLLALLGPIAVGIIFNSVIPGAQRNQLGSLTAFLLAAALATGLFNAVRGFATLRLEAKLDSSIQAAVWDRLLGLPVPFFRDYSSGDLAVRSMGINQIRETLTGSTLSSIMTSIFSVFSFALLFYYSWSLALLATGLIGIAVLVSTVSGYMQVRYQREMSKVRGRISGRVLQFIHGIAKFRVSGTENRAFYAWALEFARQKQLSTSARRIANGLKAFNVAFPALCTAFIFFATDQLNSGHAGSPLSTGDFLAFNAAFMQFLISALQLSSAMVSILGIVPLYERAKPILNTLPEVDDAKSSPGELEGLIEVNHLAFRYRPDTPLVLQDLSLTILPGQFIAIVGPSGCGKSTLLRLLLGFEAPESGALYFDRQDLAGLDLQAVRRQIGVVLQNAKLFSGSIFSNIVGSMPLTIDDAWEAARLSGLDEDIKAMPMGMHTAISDTGGGLSGGQRQRLIIARAIVNRPRIIVFDEATSALDNHTQATVSRSLEGLQATRIVIAHRISTVLSADRIYVLERGRVVQDGRYEELVRQPGPFQELAKRQVL